MPPRVLLIGGHGKVSLLMTPLLLRRSWTVTSLIRNPAQADEILGKSHGQPGTLEILVRSLEVVKSSQEARSIIDEAKPDYVVWSAGAGGKGGSRLTYAIDRDAAKHFITACANTPSVRKFLMISYIGSRRQRAPWWTDEDWASCQHVNTVVLPHYFAAKVEADECLTALAKGRGGDFAAIILRPGNLTDDNATGMVNLGKTRASGKVSRGDVADVAVRLLEKEGVHGWLDLLEGGDVVEEAVEKVATNNVDCIDGEDVEAMMEKQKVS
ncbi:hypothetical protein MMC26_002398 [Xylographa opegraphella]|nr:hypothetical protein [Xylographa opegraphella]